jgi:hypothetical protein
MTDSWFRVETVAVQKVRGERPVIHYDVYRMHRDGRKEFVRRMGRP